MTLDWLQRADADSVYGPDNVGQIFEISLKSFRRSDVYKSESGGNGQRDVRPRRRVAGVQPPAG